MMLAYQTPLGSTFKENVSDFLKSKNGEELRGKVNLILTSPPFPLNRKKKYGNLQGQDYIDWISGLAKEFRDLLTPDGSIVMEIGNSWISGKPEMSTFSLKALLAFLESGNYSLCQQFIWNNPARLPSPAQWVTVKRSRVKDAFTTIWWMSKTPYPKADNRKILTEYSKSMQNLLKSKKYNSGKRPSEHHIGETSFLKNNNGAIPSNVITLSNTQSSSDYQTYCKENGFEIHPARMPDGLAEFFIKFLTDDNDLVLDPFAGSNTTGSVAEKFNRRWISIEINESYIQGSIGRFAVPFVTSFL